MKNKLIKAIIVIFVGISLLCGIYNTPAVFANTEFSISPMKQKIVLVPGETYTGSFDVINPSSNTNDINYQTSIKPFYIDNSNNVIFENNGDYNQIVDWIKVVKNEGVIHPNSTDTVEFTIDVPKDAPAGGQYALIIVTNNGDENKEGDGVNIKNTLSIGHSIYAEVVGNTTISGNISDLNIPSFLFSGNISASSTVKNDGNVHGTGKYTLQVFPIFSNEEVYTNEEDPTEKIIMPEQELTSIIQWPNTPTIGIFNVVYTVEFEGATKQISKMVIICPIWLLFIIIFAIVALIIYIVLRAKNKGKKASR